MNKAQVILSPPDSRDFRVGSNIDISGSFPESFELWQPPVEDQGEVGNCVAQSLANIYECAEHLQGLPHRDFSVGYIYGMSDVYGMIPREACGIVCKEGDVLRDVWEDLTENPKCHLARQAVGDDITAQAVKMAEYVRINTEEELKAFILRYRLPVMIVADGRKYSAFASGNHATVCCGWNAKGKLLYTNSWGTGGMYGDGRGTINFSDVKEIWGIIPMSEKEIKFSDIEGHWAETQIKAAAKLGIVKGYEDGTFRPDKPVTRAEAAAMLIRAVNVIEGICSERY